MEQVERAISIGFVERLRRTLDMIKFEHSIFAMPFALTGALLAWRENHFSSVGLGEKLLWIVVAMVGARSAAMTFNRIADAKIDAKNPRTAMRHLPSGQLSPGFAWGFLAASVAAFILAAAMLNELCLWLSPVALAVVLLYSYMKRFSSLAHLVLGFALGIAPAAAWIAMRGSLDIRIGWLSFAVMFWTAGFDIIYACQDFEFDQREGLFSVPAKLGIAKALVLSRLFHLATLVCLLILAAQFQLHWWPVLPVAGLLLYEHSLVRADDLSKVNIAFFTVNGFIGLGYFASMAIEVFRNV
jgi:4-hydroxybenzoate polyprenyltransferase